MERALLLMFVVVGLCLTGASTNSGLLLVANKGEHTLGIIDTALGKQVATVDESGVTGHEVIASPDGKLAFVPIYGNSGVGLPGTDGSTLDVINLKTRRIVHTIDFGHGVRPHCPIFGPKNGLLYVTTELDKAVSIIDPQTFKIVGNVPTGAAESHMLALSPDGGRGYTANVGPGSVSVLDMVAKKTITVIPVANHVQRISVSPDGRWVFTSDTEKPRLAVIDAKTNKVDRWIDLPGEGYGSSSTPDGKWLLIAMPNANGVAVIDLARLSVAKTISVPAAPQETLIAPGGEMAFVSCDRSQKVAAINTRDWTVKLIDAGKAWMDWRGRGSLARARTPVPPRSVFESCVVRSSGLASSIAFSPHLRVGLFRFRRCAADFKSAPYESGDRVRIERDSSRLISKSHLTSLRCAGIGEYKYPLAVGILKCSVNDFSAGIL